MDKIGIKLANSEFYPILDHGRPARKRLVVTTVNDGQKSVQIDLYRGAGPMVREAVYVGSLVVEEIPEGKAGEPDVRLDLELDENDTLRCTAVEAETGATQSIRVSLETLSEEDSYEVPDFDLGEETDSLPSEATSPEEGAGLLASAEELRAREERRSALPLILIIVLVLLAALSLLWFFALRPAAGNLGARGASAPVAAATTAPLPATPAPAAASAPRTAPIQPAAGPATPAPKAPAPSQGAATSAGPVPASASASGTAPKPPAPAAEGKRYRIKWGDTLWDLAWAYYRNPWLYTRIAKANHIKNPDHIISGTWILIPPR